MKKIYVVGYPRSGNVWMARALSDLFKCQIKGSGDRISIAQRDEPKSKDCIVIQDHFGLHYKESDKFTDGVNMCLAHKPDSAYIVFVYRHPFDVAVSVCKYWSMKNVMEALISMRYGKRVPKYYPFMMGWIDALKYIDLLVPYEKMHFDLSLLLSRASRDNGLQVSSDRLLEIEKQNSFLKMRGRVVDEKRSFSYHTGIQLKHLRKGIVGDWKNHFRASDTRFALDFMDDILICLGYYPEGLNSPEEVKAHYMMETIRAK